MENNIHNAHNAMPFNLPVHAAPKAVWTNITETLDEITPLSTSMLADSLPVHAANPTSWNNIVAHLPAQKLSWITPLFLNIILFGCIIILLLPAKGDVNDTTKTGIEIAETNPVSSSSRQGTKNTALINKGQIDKAQKSRAKIRTKAIEEKEPLIINDVNSAPQPVEEPVISPKQIQHSQIDIPTVPDFRATQSFSAKVIPLTSALPLFPEVLHCTKTHSSHGVSLPVKGNIPGNWYLRPEAGIIFSITDYEKQDHFDTGYEAGLILVYYSNRMRYETGVQVAEIHYQGSQVLNYFQFNYVGTVIDMQVEEGFRILPSGDTIQTIKYNPVLRDIYDSVSAEYDAEITNRIKYVNIPLLAGLQIVRHKRYDLFLSGGAIVSIPVSTKYNDIFSPEGYFKISQGRITVPLDVKTRLLFCGQLDATVHITNMLSWYAGIAIRYGKGKNGFNTEYSEWKEWQGTIKTGIQIQF